MRPTAADRLAPSQPAGSRRPFDQESAHVPRHPRPRVIADAFGRSAVRNAVLIIAGAAFVGLAAQVAIPLPFTPVPLTGQTFAVLLTAASLGLWRGRRLDEPSMRLPASLVCRGSLRGSSAFKSGALTRQLRLHPRLHRRSAHWSVGWPSGGRPGPHRAPPA